MIVYNTFEWDFREAASNLATYGVSFKEASTVFAAEDVAITQDLDSDQLYARGHSSRGRVLVVAHTRGVRVRIVGAMAPAEARTEIAPEPNAEAEVTAVARSEDAGAVSAENVGAASAENAGAQRIQPEATATEATAVTGLTAVAGPPEAAVAPEPAPEVVASSAASTAPEIVATLDEGEARPSSKPALPALPRPRGRPRRVPREATAPERSEPQAVAGGAPSGGRLPTTGMTAEEYGVYWEAYAAARDGAKLEGKSLHVAQRIGREAGELAVASRAPAPKSASRAPAPKSEGPSTEARTRRSSSSWREAARAVK